MTADLHLFDEEGEGYSLFSFTLGAGSVRSTGGGGGRGQPSGGSAKVWQGLEESVTRQMEEILQPVAKAAPESELDDPAPPRIIEPILPAKPVLTLAQVEAWKAQQPPPKTLRRRVLVIVNARLRIPVRTV